ncbi:MAG: YkgJ family cysteine cluster protein [Myxococcales bacterium]|nr:YkgJ family cysteine cluster protein [Myxococcales bacterium]
MHEPHSQPTSDPPECLDCGACCFADLPHYVPVRGDDYARLGDAAETLTRWQGTRCFMAMSDGHCAALVIDAGSGRFSCSVYADRPDTCRELERGSSECEGERERKYARTRRRLPLL